MSYYEVPEHCAKCGIEINYGGKLCLVCWKIAKDEYDAEQSERA